MFLPAHLCRAGASSALVGLLLVATGCNEAADIKVAPDSPRLTNAMRDLKLQATVVNASGDAIQGAKANFISLTPSVVTVTGDGTLHAIRSGQAKIQISSGKLKKEVVAVVRLAKRIAIEPDSPRLMLGVSRGFKATVYDDQGEPMLAGKVRWTTSDPAIMTVDADGNVKTLTEGLVTLTAHAADISSATTITVRHEQVQEDGSLD